ncbi:hypothetical protein AOQ84DRAFT_385274 [Glonium stellatum]|uniref:Uncharacterized protein n=1 Tax=Glonium stellatum TaxID=574774 RepID=A0A8E2FAL5_9PEZI|nr:hypothetical protein AOQ84DRAFT_385274 [Glonium stellatum]
MARYERRGSKIVDLTNSSPEPSPPGPSSVPSGSAKTNVAAFTLRTTMPWPRNEQLQQYIGAHWVALSSTDRKRARDIICRGDPSFARKDTNGKTHKLDLSRLSNPNLEELYRHIYNVKHPGSQPAELTARHVPKDTPIQSLAQRTAGFPNSSRATLPVPPSELVRHVIMSSDPIQVRDLFFQLCESSPALSRAAVRCLAHHSDFAQSTLRPGHCIKAEHSIFFHKTPNFDTERLKSRRSAPGPSSYKIKRAFSKSVSPSPNGSFYRPPLTQSLSRGNRQVSGSSSTSSIIGKKRKTSPDGFACAQCGEDLNGSGCMYHPGYLIPNKSTAYRLERNNDTLD